MHFRNSFKELKAADVEIVIAALTEALHDPVIRPVSASKLSRTEKVL